MRVHYIEDEENLIAYFPRTLRYFAINKIMQSFINAIESGMDKESIILQLGITSDQYEMFNQRIQESLGTDQYLMDEYKEKASFLEKLSINISNDCNLRCKYCYANGGNYHSPREMMSIETAQRTLDVFFNHFKVIQKLSLFGGEPTQNLPVMKHICEYVHQRNLKVEEKTYIGLVTNGTQVTDELIDLINKYDLQVTISFDGTKEMNDIARVFPNGEGTSDIVLTNIKKLQKYTSQPAGIEVTYHKKHQENNMSILDITKAIKKDIGDVSIHLVPMGCNQNESKNELMLDDLSAFVDAIDEVFSEEGEGLSYTFVDCILEGLTKKTPSKYICDAAIGALSVSAKGDIYPCSVLTDRKDEWGGSVYDEDVLSGKQFEHMMNRYLTFNKIENQRCSQCFAHTVCYACLGMNAITNGNPFELDGQLCELNRKMLEEIIKKLNRIKHNR